MAMSVDDPICAECGHPHSDHYVTFGGKPGCADHFCEDCACGGFRRDFNEAELGQIRHAVRDALGATGNLVG